MTNIYRQSFIWALLLAFIFSITPSLRAEDETLTNASVIELQNLSLGDAVLIEKIKTSKCNFDTSITGLKQLKVVQQSLAGLLSRSWLQ